MKKKKKALLCCCAALALLVCLIPERRLYKDGGTVEYRALLYRVTQWHAIIEAATQIETTREGLEIQILSLTLYDGRRLVETRYCGQVLPGPSNPTGRRFLYETARAH